MGDQATNIIIFGISNYIYVKSPSLLAFVYCMYILKTTQAFKFTDGLSADKYCVGL
jgi:hypothetical protein